MEERWLLDGPIGRELEQFGQMLLRLKCTEFADASDDDSDVG